MRAIVLGLLLGWPCMGLQAFTNFVQNPYTPYPRACNWFIDWADYAWDSSDDDNRRVKFHEGAVNLQRSGFQGGPVTMEVKAYRVSCPEANRSQILLQFTSPGNKDGFYAMPRIRAIVDGNKPVLMGLSQAQGTWNLAEWPAAQPTSFGMTNCSGNNGYCAQMGWTFVLDNKSPLIPGAEASEFLTAEQYNGSFRLELNWNGSSVGDVIEVPATAPAFHEPALTPLSGRHSGLWVIDGTADQGFNIAISELVTEKADWIYQYPYRRPLLLFLSWYTFDADGLPLWLTGSAEFLDGASEVSFPLILVTDGEFFGDRQAERKIVGEVKVTANSCNNLGFEYELVTIGLGSGSEHLQRILSLELAGHTCRDMAARIEANH